MQGLLIPLSIVIWIAIWVLIVKKRGRLGKVAGNVIGSLVGFVAATVFLGALVPKADPEDRPDQARTVQPPSASQPSGVPAAAIDQITLLYINHKIYPNDPTVCEAKRIGSRDMVACHAQGWGGNSQVHVWEYSKGKFKSINGSARSLAETKFSNESAVEMSPLPLPGDIKVDEVVKAFAKG